MLSTKLNPPSRLRPIAAAVTLAFAFGHLAQAQQIVVSGKTQTNLQMNGNVTDVTTATVRGANAFNSFSKFDVYGGNVVNLHVPNGATNLLNLVDGPTSHIDGMLNAVRNGAIGGNVFFANPNGIVVGPGGVINAGALTLLTPQQSFIDSFFDAAGEPNAGATAAMLNGTVPINENGLILIKGRINTAGDASLLGGSITNSGAILSGAAFTGVRADFADIVNVAGMQTGGAVSVEGGKIRILAREDVVNRGTVASTGSSGHAGGDIEVRAGRDILVGSGSLISARGQGEHSNAGNVTLIAQRDATLESGALIDARGGASGDGGFVEFSGYRSVRLLGTDIRASAERGLAGSILIDPDDDLVISVNMFTDGVPLTLDANKTINVGSNVIISTRNLQDVNSEDHLTALSKGNSGNLTLTAPRITLNSGAKLLAHAINDNSTSFTAGDITLKAEDKVERFPFDLLFSVDNASSKIELNGATLKGRKVTLTADAQTKKVTDEDDSPVEQFVSDLGLLTFSGIAGVSMADANAEIKVGANSLIEASGDVTISATAKAASQLTTLGYGLGVGYVESKATAKAHVDSGAVVNAGANAVSIKAVTENTAANSVISGVASVDLTLAVTRVQTSSEAYAAAGSKITAGKLTISANNKNNLETSSSPLDLIGGGDGISLAYSELKSNATAYAGGEATLSSDALVQAKSQTEKHATGTSADPPSAVPDQDDYSGKKIFGGRSTSSESDGGKLDIGAGVAYSEATNTANAYIGSSAKVRSSGAITVDAQIEDNFQVISISNAEGNKVSLAGAAAVGLYSNTANAFLAAGADVAAATALTINAVTKTPSAFNPASLLPTDVWEGFKTVFSAAMDLEGLLAEAIFNSYSRAAGKAEGDQEGSSGQFGAAGAVTFIDIGNHANAYVGINAKVNTPGTVTANGQSVTVHAENEIETVNLAGVYSLTIKPNESGGNDGKASIGGAYTQITYGASGNPSSAKAYIADGAQVNAAGNITVSADNKISAISITLPGGSAEKFGVDGAFSLIRMYGDSFAFIDDGAKVTSTGKVSVTAHSDVDDLNVSGAVIVGSNIGLGFTVSINEITANTKAFIGLDPATTDALTGSVEAASMEVSATSKEDIGAYSLAAALKKQDSGQSAGQDSGKGKFGIQFSGDASVNRISGDTLAYINGGVVVTPGISLDLTATNDTTLRAVAGAVAISTDQNSAGIAGSFTMNTLDTESRAYIEDATILESTPGTLAMRLDAESLGSILAITAGGSGAGKVGIAGSVSINEISDVTQSYISRTSVDAASVSLSASDSRDIFSVAGALAFGGKAGIGASVAWNDIDNDTSAYFDQSDVGATGTLTLTASNQNDLRAIAAAIAASSGTMAAAGAFSRNVIDNGTLVYIRGKKSSDGVDGSNVSLIALDQSAIQSIAGAIGGAATAGFGASAGLNQITNTVSAGIDGGADVHATDTLQLSATVGGSGSSIETLSAGGAAAGDVAIGGAASVNQIGNDVKAFVSGATATAANDVTIAARDQSTIKSLAASAAGSGTLAVGVVGAYNEIDNDVKAYADNATVASTSGSVRTAATSVATIDTIAGAGAGAGTAGVAGAIAINVMSNAVEAYLQSSTVSADDTVAVIADSRNDGTIYGGSVSFGGTAGVGGSAAATKLANETRAYISGSSSVDAKGNGTQNAPKMDDSNGTDALRGVAVIAKSKDTVTSYTANAAGGGTAGVAATVSVTLGNDVTEAYIGARQDGTGPASTVAINASNGGANANQAVRVKAYGGTKIDVAAGGLAAGGVAGVGATADVAIIANQTRAYVRDVNTLNAKSAVEVASKTQERINSIVVSGAAAGTAAVAGSVAVVDLANTNEAYVRNSHVTSNSSVAVTADDDTWLGVRDNGTRSGILAGNVAIGGVAGVGGSASVTTVTNTTRAHITDSTVNASGSTNVNADSATDVVAYAASGNVGGYVGAGGAVSVNTVKNTTEAYINEETGQSLINQHPALRTATQDVRVTATDHTDVDAVDGAANVGSIVGAGASIDVTSIKNTTAAYIGANTDVSAGRHVEVTAASTKTVDSSVIAMGGGLVGVQGAVSIINIGAAMNSDAASASANTGSAVNAQISGSFGNALGDSDTAGKVKNEVNAKRAALNVNAEFSQNATPSQATSAYVGNGATVSAGLADNSGDLRVQATDTARVDILVGAASVGAVSLGGAVGVAAIHGNAVSFIGRGAQVRAADDIDVLANVNVNDSDIDAVAGSAGLVGLGAAVAYLDATGNANAYVDNTAAIVHAGDVTVAATGTSDLNAEALGVAAGGLVVGGSYARAKIDGDITANVGDVHAAGATGSTAIGSANDKVGSVTIRAESTDSTKALARAGAAGVTAGSGSAADAIAAPKVKATTGAQTQLYATNAATIQATAKDSADATAQGVSASVGVSVGVSIAQARVAPLVSAYTGAGNVVQAGSLALLAAQALPATGFSARANTFGAAGGALLGASATESKAENDSVVFARLGTGIITVPGTVDINAATSTRQRAYSSGINVGIVALGANLADADSDSATRATVADGVTGSAGTLNVSAIATDDNYADSKSGSGGVVAGAAAEASTRVGASTIAEIGGGAIGNPLKSNALQLHAEHTSLFNGRVDSLGAGVVGASGAIVQHDIVSDVLALFHDSSRIETSDLFVLAQNNAAKPWLADFNTQAAAGGLLAGAAAFSGTDIHHDTLVKIGDGASVMVTGDRKNPKHANLSAVNQIDVRDRAKLDTGGAISIAMAESTIHAGNANDHDVTQVLLGNGALLDSVGDVNIGARTKAYAESSANAKTYGLAAAAEGQSETRLWLDNKVTVTSGARIRADGDVNLMAGRDQGQANDIDAIARTDLYNKTAFPIETDPKADAEVGALNLVDVQSGASVGAVKNVNLLSDNGSVFVQGQGVGKDLYREVLAAIGSFFSNLFGGGDISLDIHAGTSTTNTLAGVRVDGGVSAGIQNKQHLTLSTDQRSYASNGDLTGYTIKVDEQSEGITFTRGVENLAQNLSAEITRLEKLKVEYKGNADAILAYDFEIARIKEELVALGFAAVVNAEGQQTVYYNKNQNVSFVTVNDVLARGGNVNVTGDYLSGGGSLRAPNDTEIRIINDTPDFLRIHELTIPTDQGGKLTLNGEALDCSSTASCNALINDRNLVKLAAFSSIEKAGPNTPAPSIVVESRYNPALDNNVLRAPDLVIVDDVTNLGGSISLRNERGSINITGQAGNTGANIDGKSVDIFAGKSITQSYVNGFVHIGGNPQVLWDDVADGNQTNKTNFSQNDASRNGSGGRIAGDSLVISARYLNINGLLQAGLPDWAVTIGAGAETEITARQAQYDAAIASGKVMQERFQLDSVTSTSTGSQKIATFWNARTKQIELEGVSVQGGRIDLFGEILNTGGGEIKVVDGFGKINVTNNTAHDLVIKGLDVGTDIEGRVTITDLGKRWTDGKTPITTIVRRVGNEVRVEQKAGNVSLGAETVAGTDRANSYAYDPITGQRYVWNSGQNFSRYLIRTAREDSALWGGIPTGSVNYNQPDIIQPKDNVALLEPAEWTPGTKGASQGADYAYTFTRTPTEGRTFVSRVPWSECNDFLCFTQSYYVQDTFVEGYREIHTFSLKADKSIPIRFIGQDTGAIDVTSVGNVLLQSNVRNASGTTNLHSTGGAIVSGGTAIVTSRDLWLDAKTGIGGATAPVQIDLQGGALRATTVSGDVAVRELVGNMNVDLISTGLGKVTLDSAASIVAAAAPVPGRTAVAANAARVLGTDIELIARDGGIGSSELQPLRIQTSVGDTGSVSARAQGDIYLSQPSLDLGLNRVESLGGNVWIEAVNGSIVDANSNETRDVRAEDELLAQWKSMLLLECNGAANCVGAEDSRDATLDAYKIKQERDYRTYWTQVRQIKEVDDGHGNKSYVAGVAYDPNFLFPLDPGEETYLKTVRHMSDADILALRLQKTQEFGASNYDPSYVYVMSAQTRSQLAQGFSWTQNELKTALSPALLFKQTSDTETRIEQANVRAAHVTLKAEQGSVGKNKGSIVIDGNKTSLENDERLALAAAEADDVFGDADTKQITVLQRDDVDVELISRSGQPGSVLVTARDHVYLGSEKDINVEAVKSGQTIRIKGAENIYDVSITGPALTGGNAILEAAHGAIGTQAKPLGMNLDQGATVVARAGGNVYLQELLGDMNVTEIFTTQGVHLLSQGSIFDARNGRQVAIQAHALTLDALTGSVGTLISPLLIDLGEGSVSATAFGDIGLANPRGKLVVDRVTAGGDALLQALGDIGATAGTSPSVVAHGVTLTSIAGGVGSSAARLRVDSNGTFNIGAFGNVYAEEQLGDMLSTLLTSTAGAVDLAVDGNGRFGSIDAFGNVRLRNRAGSLQADSVSSQTGAVDIEANGNGNFGSLLARNDIRVRSATGNLQANLVRSQQDFAALSASAGATFGTIEALQDIAAFALGGDLAATRVASTAGTVRVEASGAGNFDTIDAQHDATVVAHGGGLTASRISSAAGAVLVDANAAGSFGTIEARHDVRMFTRTGDVAAQRVTSQTGSIHIDAGGDGTFDKLTAPGDVNVRVAGGSLKINDIDPANVNLSVAQAGGTLDVQRAQVGNNFMASADTVQLHEVAHTGAGELHFVVTGPGGTADMVNIHTSSASGIVFDSLSASTAFVDAQVASLKFNDARIGLRGRFNSNAYVVDLDNVGTKRYGNDLQLVARGAPLSLEFFDQPRFATSAVVLDHSERVQVDGFDSDNTVTRAVPKLLATVDTGVHENNKATEEKDLEGVVTSSEGVVTVPDAIGTPAELQLNGGR